MRKKMVKCTSFGKLVKPARCPRCGGLCAASCDPECEKFARWSWPALLNMTTTMAADTYGMIEAHLAAAAAAAAAKFLGLF